MREQDSRLRVAVDARAVRWREGTGIARYRENLACAAAMIGSVERVGDGTAQLMRRNLRVLRPSIRLRRDGDDWRGDDLYRLAQRHFTLTGRLLTIDAAAPPDLVHWSYPMPLRWRGIPNICTIHDLIPIEAPTLTGISARRQNRMLRGLIAAGTRFVTVSETVRAAVVERYRLPAASVVCCYQPVEHQSPGALPLGFSPDGYMLALGRVEPRKNVGRLIDAYRRSGVTIPLLVVGPDGDWPSRAERRRVEAMLRLPPIMRLGWQSDATIAALLANARALLMPSLAEGFGLPIVEAMVAGVPALAPDRGAAAEIADGAALAIDPGDTAAIARGIARLDSDEALRAELIGRGRARAAAFGMETFATRLRALYEATAHGEFGAA